MKQFLKTVLPLLLLAVMMGTALGAQAKTKKASRTVYYIVCGSYSSLDKAIKQSEQMSGQQRR